MQVRATGGDAVSGVATAIEDDVPRREVLERLRQVSDEQSRAVILIMHDQAIAAGASRVVRMRDGRLAGSTVAEGSANALPIL
jgi:ABC-type lipoprotein export system ATPase subunit